MYRHQRTPLRPDDKGQDRRSVDRVFACAGEGVSQSDRITTQLLRREQFGQSLARPLLELDDAPRQEPPHDRGLEGPRR